MSAIGRLCRPNRGEGGAVVVRMPEGKTRQRVLEVAQQLFATHGYDRTSLREIAAHLGVSKAALYYHFPAKEDILLALAGDLIDEVAAMTSQAEQAHDLSPAAREQLLVGLIDLLFAHRGTAELLLTEGQALAHTDIGERAHRALARAQQLLLPEHPRVEDRVRGAAALGVAQSALYNLADVEPEQLRDLVVEIALACLHHPLTPRPA